MRILIFNWQDIKNPLSGGAEVHLHEIFSRVAAMGHEVTLFCSSFPDAVAEENVSGIRVIREGRRHFFNFLVPFRYYTRFRHDRYDVVIDDMNKIPFFTPLFVREPLAIVIHHLFDKSIFQEATLPIALYVYWVEKLAVALLRRRRTPLFVVSPSTRDEMMTHGIHSENISIVPNCVDHVLYHPAENSRSTLPLIGYFGRIKKYKSVDHLLRAFVPVVQKMPKVKLVVIGDGDYRPELERLTRELGIVDAVRFTGYVDEQEKVRLLREVWFLVNTSAKEGWGLTVIESNACKTAVIASNVPGLRDAVKNGETGVLYGYGNINEMSEKILMLLNDLPLRKRLEEQAYTWSQEFDWQIVAKNTIQLLEEQIARHRKGLPTEAIN